MAHVVAMKSVDVRAAEKAVVGQPLTVSVTLKNMGSGAAKKIKVTDAKDLTNLEMVKGSMDHEYASLGAGETVEYSYTVKPTAAGALSLSDAEGTYDKAEGKPAKTVTAIPALPSVVTSMDATRQKILTVGSYLSLGINNTAKDWMNTVWTGVVLGGGYVAYVTYSGILTAREDRARQLSLKALGLSDMKSD